MIAGAIALLGGPWRAGIFGALILGGGWFFFHSKTVAYENGKDAGRVEAYESEKKRMQAESAAAHAQIEQERSELEIARNVLNSERVALQGQRREIVNVVNRGLGTLAGREIELRNEVLGTAEPDVDARFRVALTRAREADRRLATIRATQQ